MQSPYLNPKWEDAGRVHDWKNHVPDEVQEIWATFSEPQKAALYLWAETLSDAEKWE